MAERPRSINIDKRAKGETRRNNPKIPRAIPDPVAISVCLRVWKSRTKAVKNGSNRKEHSRAISHTGVPGSSE